MDESDVLDLTKVDPEPDSRVAERRKSQANLFGCAKTRLQLASLAKKYIEMGAPLTGLVLRQGERKRGRAAPEKDTVELVGILGAGRYNSAIRLCAPKGHCVVDFAAKIGVGQREIEITKFLSEFVERGYTQGLPLFYGSQDFTVRRISVTTGKPVVEISTCMLFELADGAFHSQRFLDRFEYSDNLLSFIQGFVFQGLQALRTVNLHSLFVQNDLHLANMLAHEVDPGGHWNYELTHGSHTRSYKVPNYGLVLVIGDFGQAYLREKDSSRNYLLSREIKDFIEVLYSRVGSFLSNTDAHRDWLANLAKKWSQFCKSGMLDKAHSEDPLGDFIEASFFDLFEKPVGREICSFDDGGRDLSVIPLPKILYREGGTENPFVFPQPMSNDEEAEVEDGSPDTEDMTSDERDMRRPLESSSSDDDDDDDPESSSSDESD